MAGPAKKRAQLEEAKDLIGRNLRTVTEFEEGIARLVDKGTEAWVSYMKHQLQQAKNRLEARKTQLSKEDYETTAKEFYTRRLSKYEEPLVIEITELAQIASTETKAWTDAAGIVITLQQLYSSLKQNESELQENERMEVVSQESEQVADDDSAVQKLKSDIEAYTDKIKEYHNIHDTLYAAAIKATVAMNLAVKSDLNIPGVGKYISIPAPVTVTTARVKVADLACSLEAAGKDITVDEASGAIVPRPKSVTAIVTVDPQLSKIQLCSPQKHYTDVQRMKRFEFKIGDIGWFPVLRPSFVESPSDIHTEYGYICAKSYPLIIVEKLQDCMLGLIISTANRTGLHNRDRSIVNRSVPINKYTASSPTSSDWGYNLYPRKWLRVSHSSRYQPPKSAYVDMLNTIMIPYDTRFRKEGELTGIDVLPLQQMRLSVILGTSGLRTDRHTEFCNWLKMWADNNHTSSTLKYLYNREALELKWVQAKKMAEEKSKAEAGAKIEAKMRSEAKEREEAMERVESKKREEAKEYEEAKQREDARKRTMLAHAKATWNRMFAPGREDAKIQMDRNVRALTRGASRGPNCGF